MTWDMPLLGDYRIDPPELPHRLARLYCRDCGDDYAAEACGETLDAIHDAEAEGWYVEEDWCIDDERIYGLCPDCRADAEEQ